MTKDPVEQSLDRIRASARTDGDGPLAFPHVPKTGGQTLRSHFANHLRLHRDFFHLGPWGLARAEELGIDLYKELEERSDYVRVVFGHDVSIAAVERLERRVSLAITLREPAEQVVSFYNFRMLYDPWEPFETFFARVAYRDCMVRWIAANFLRLPVKRMSIDTAFDAVCEALGYFRHICLTERLAESTAPLFEEAGLPPLAPKQRKNVCGRDFARSFTLTPAWRARIEEQSPRDFALYRACKQGQMHNHKECA